MCFRLSRWRVSLSDHALSRFRLHNPGSTAAEAIRAVIQARELQAREYLRVAGRISPDPLARYRLALGAVQGIFVLRPARWDADALVVVTYLRDVYAGGAT